MSQLDDAMFRRIEDLVLKEGYSFSYRDFLEFEISGKKYSMSHGTFRNKISKLIKEQKVEVEYYSGIAFYTLKGCTFGIRRKSDPMRVPRHALYELITDLPLRQRAIHDIRLQFKVPYLWSILSRYSNSINHYSKDIRLPKWEFRGATVKSTVHKTNTVSVIVACSSTPFSLDYIDIIRLSNTLTLVEERMNLYITEICHEALASTDSLIWVPPHMDWMVTMWHFGADAVNEFTGQRFCISWKVAEKILIRVYSKNINGKACRIRLEKQELPMKTLAQAIEEKLNNTI